MDSVGTAIRLYIQQRVYFRSIGQYVETQTPRRSLIYYSIQGSRVRSPARSVCRIETLNHGTVTIGSQLMVHLNQFHISRRSLKNKTGSCPSDWLQVMI